MSGAKHTPGPWVHGRVHPSYGEIQILGGPRERYVCNVQIHQAIRAFGLIDEPERLANAQLILAAPDLLRELKALVDAVKEASRVTIALEEEDGHQRGARKRDVADGVHIAGDIVRGYLDGLDELVERAEAAIAKAEASC